MIRIYENMDSLYLVGEVLLGIYVSIMILNYIVSITDNDFHYLIDLISNLVPIITFYITINLFCNLIIYIDYIKWYTVVGAAIPGALLLLHMLVIFMYLGDDDKSRKDGVLNLKKNLRQHFENKKKLKENT